MIELVSMLPWWAGVALALVLYGVLHWWATQPLLTAVPARSPGTVMVQTIWHGLASVGQYALPLVCLGGAAVSAWKRHERKALVSQAVRSPAADSLDGMSWQQFERLVGEAFRFQGYRVVETGQGGADGGIDLVLTKGNEKFVVQCKQWKAFKVGVDVIRELYGVMAAKGSTGGFVVTSGRFTEDASKFADGRNIALIDGPKLQQMIRSAASSALPDRTEPSASAVGRQGPGTASPACPICAKPMARRIAKRGANAGGEFWGCTAYPSCKGTRSA